MSSDDKFKFTLPTKAKFERRVKATPVEASLETAMRKAKAANSENGDKIDEILRKATKEIEAL